MYPGQHPDEHFSNISEVISIHTNTPENTNNMTSGHFPKGLFLVAENTVYTCKKGQSA